MERISVNIFTGFTKTQKGSVIASFFLMSLYNLEDRLNCLIHDFIKVLFLYGTKLTIDVTFHISGDNLALYQTGLFKGMTNKHFVR